MNISASVEIIKTKDDTYRTTINGVKTLEIDADRITEAELLYNECAKVEQSKRSAVLERLVSDGKLTHLIGTIADVVDATDILKRGLGNLVNFFKEFQFEPNFRFVNTLSHALAIGTTNAVDYIKSYFELIDSPYINEITDKVKSVEFKGILKDISAVPPTKTVNNRFKLYYGSQGTGKTTIAQTETDNRCVVCNSSMLPSDLMEDFAFDSGKATFKHSALWDCMEKGEKIVLDEINLLPFDSLRFLQGVLDGKKEFLYKGETVHINDGFGIIGTMNLSVNGMVYGLPEPLVDRCAEMRKFTLSAEMLVGAIS